MTGRIVIEVEEENNIGIFVRNLEPYDLVRILISTSLALLEGNAEVIFNDGPPLTEEDEREIISSLVERSPPNAGGQRDN